MEIDLYSARWHSDLVRIAEDVFGKGYFASPAELAGEDGALMIVCYEDADTLLGFAQGQLLPENGLDDYLERRAVEVPPDIADADAKGALGLIQAVAVAAGHRRRGIGTRLIEVLHDRLVGMGADKLVVTFKKGRTKSAVDGMMGKLGFDVWARVPSYWRERCESGDFACSDRQGPACTCDALLYRKSVY